MNEGRPATYQTFPSHLCIHNYKATYSAASFAETESHLISPPYSHSPHPHHQHKTTDQKSPLTSQESTFSGSSCAIQRIHHSAERAFNTPRCLVLAACWCCGGIRWFGNWSYWSSALLVTRHFISHRRAVWPFKRRSVSISGRLFSRNSIQNALAVGGCSGGVTDGG